MVAVKHVPDVQTRDFDLEPRSFVRNDPRDFEIEARDIVLSENAGQFYDEELDVAILTPHRLAYRAEKLAEKLRSLGIDPET